MMMKMFMMLSATAVTTRGMKFCGMNFCGLSAMSRCVVDNRGCRGGTGSRAYNDYVGRREFCRQVEEELVRLHNEKRSMRFCTDFDGHKINGDNANKYMFPGGTLRCRCGEPTVAAFPGCRPLQTDPRLTEIARPHNEYMMKAGDTSHDGWGSVLSYQGTPDRSRETQVGTDYCGENAYALHRNICRNGPPSRVAEIILHGWLTSKGKTGHRDQIVWSRKQQHQSRAGRRGGYRGLATNYRRIGIAVNYYENGSRGPSYWATAIYSD